MRQLLGLIILLGFMPHAYGKDYSVKHRANCGCEYINIDGRVESKHRVFGIGTKSQAERNARKNCKKLAPMQNYNSYAISCVFDRVKVDTDGNVLSMKRVSEEETLIASEIEDLM